MAIVQALKTEPEARRRLSIASPATLEPVGEFECATAEDVAEAVARARKAQPAWAALSCKQRAAYVYRALEILIDRQEEFIETVMKETGKTRMEAIMMEIFASCDAMGYWARRSGKILKPRRKRMHLLGMLKSLKVVYKPLGVVGIITPWNGPFVLSLNPTVQALMAGNAVILKPSEITPYSGGQVGKLFEAAGLPEGVLQIVLGDGETGAALVEADVDKISFTGSVATGRKVGEACGRQLIPCTLELGGKDPSIVCSDADIDRAVNGIVFGACMNAGQVCMSVERVYVAEQIADEFTDRLVSKMKSLRQSDTGECDVGPIIWPKQLEIIERHVEDARTKGAKILAGGRRREGLKGLYYEPTVVTGVTHDMAIMREETFGPVVAIMRVANEAEALRLANDTNYGLTASVWSKDKHRAYEIGMKLDAGSICINDAGLTYGAMEAPFGGVKNSGVGRVNSEEGLRGYCHAVPVISDRFVRKDEGQWYPFTVDKEKGLQKTLRMLWGTPLRWFVS
jgi:acyl-CoA reductase-like NAD-dependent aldehyde dehydrogenase